MGNAPPDDPEELNIGPAHAGMIEIDGVQGFLIEGDARCLYHKVQHIPQNGTVVEIGSFMGLSAIVMTRGLLASQNTGARIYCVDTWDYPPDQQNGEVIEGRDVYQTFIRNIERAGASPFIHPIRKNSTDAAISFPPGSVDLLFVDGDHSFEGCYADLQAWFPKVRPGGLVIGHDCDPQVGVRQAVQRFAAERGLTFSILEPPEAYYIFEMTVPGVTRDSHAREERSFERIPTVVRAASRASESHNALEIEESVPKHDLRVAIIYDNTVRKDTTGEYCRRALERLCTEVWHFLPTDVRNIRPEYDLYVNIDDGLKYKLPPNLHPCVYWAIDTHLQYDWHLQKARDFDWVFAAQKDGAELLRRDGIHNATWLPLGCDPEVHRPMHEFAKVYDISFVGNIPVGADERASYLSLIRQRFPNCFLGNAYFEDMARIYSQSRIVFNRSVKNDINMRVFEALSCGSLLLTNDLAENGQDELFTPGEHLVTYRDAEEFVKLVQKYLRDDAERERIARNGQIEAHRRHTYFHRMQRLLGEVTGQQGQENKAKQSYYSFARPEIQALVPHSAKHILDIGCAAGALGQALKARQDCEVTGIEVVPEIATEARSRIDRVITGDIEELVGTLPEGQFDCIILADVLEHLREPESVLACLKKLLTGTGVIVASVPNVRHWTVIKDLLEGRWDYTDAGILDRTHLRFFTKTSLLEMFQRSGLHISKMQGTTVDEHGVPQCIAGLAGWQGIDTSSLIEEAGVYQYLLTAQRQNVPARGRSGISHEASSSRSAEGHKSLAEQLIAAGKLKEASQELRSAIELRPDYAEAYNDLGAICFAEKHYGKAKDRFLKALQLDPCNATAQNNLADLLEFLSANKLTSIVILTHNELKYTKLCIESIRKFTQNPYELIFVDNGSSDGTQDYLRSIDGATVVSNPLNLGFAMGCNQGIARAKGDYILLLNNDVVVTQDWLKNMIYWAEADPAVGIVGPMSNYVAGIQWVPAVTYGDDLALMHNYARHFGDVNACRGFPAYRVIGFCSLIKRPVLDKIGGLDPRFGSGNFEDDDFCVRAVIAGYKIWVAGDVFIHHFGSRTFIGSRIDYKASMEQNWRKFKEKWRLKDDPGLEEGYSLDKLSQEPFDPNLHFVPLVEETSSTSCANKRGAGQKASARR